MATVEELLADLKAEHKIHLIQCPFSGFSEESVNFFDEYPEDKNEATVWWNSKGGNLETGDYQMYLKPELLSLIKSLIIIISSRIDKRIQTDVNQSISRPNSQSGNRRYWPYLWSAIHYAKKEKSNKSVEIQFFINLTKMGLRVGVYVGKHPTDKGQWKATMRRFRDCKEDIFNELIFLTQKRGYDFVKTNDQDHAIGSIGTKLIFHDAMELFNLVNNDVKEFTLLKTISKDKLYSENLIEEILEIFAETRKMYELLESPSKINQRRLITG